MKKIYVLFSVLLLIPLLLGAQTVFDNATVSSTYVLSGTELPTVADVDTEEAFSTTQFLLGSGLQLSTLQKVSNDLTATLFDEPNAVALTMTERLPNNVLTFILTPTKGVTFKPTNISFKCFRNGTGDDVKVDVINQRGEAAEVVLSTVEVNRNREDEGFYSTVSLDITDAVASNDSYILKLYPWGKGMRLGKGFAVSDLVITGVSDGTVIVVPKFTLSPVVNPEGAGSITVVPSGTVFDEGTVLKLTAEKNFGYQFVNWTNPQGTVLTDQALLELTLMADTTLTANFEAINTYELAIKAPVGVNDYMFDLNPASTLIEGKNMYETDASVSVTPRSNAIMSFSAWADGNPGPDTSIVMTADVNLEAVYDVKNYLAGWDFYYAGNKDRSADFASADNQAAKFSLIKADGGSDSWLDKSEVLGAMYEGKFAAVNWKLLADKYYYQTCVNASMFNNIKVTASMLHNYNAYQKQLVEYSLDGTNFTTLDTITMETQKVWYTKLVELPEAANYASKVYIRWIPDYTSDVVGTESEKDGAAITDVFVYAEGLKTDAKVEITDSVVINPNFDTNINGWTTTTGASSNKIATNQTGDFTVPFWENWRNTSFTGKMYQVINGLPRGSYLLRAAAFCNNAGDGFYLFANTGKTQVKTKEPTYHEVVGVVTDGKLEIGLLAEQATNNWVGLDNVQVYSLGFILNDMITALEGVVLEAEAISGDMQASVAGELADAVTIAKAAVASRVEADVVASLSALPTKMEAANASINFYASFPALLDKANYIYRATAADAADFLAAITAANDAFVAKTADQVAYDNLVAAIASYRVANDVTAYVVNADMSDGSVVGWASDFGEQTRAYPGLDGKFLEKWISSASNLADFDLNQIIADLPNGTYTLSVWCIATKQNQTGDAAKSYVQNVYLYGNDDSTAVSSLNGIAEEFLLNVTVDDDTLKLGFAGINCTANWVCIDNVRLMSHDVATLLDAKQISLNELIADAEAVVSGVDSVMLGDEAFKYAVDNLDALNLAIDSAKAFTATTVNEYVEIESYLGGVMNDLLQVNLPLSGQLFNIVHSSGNFLDVVDGVKIKTVADSSMYQWFKMVPLNNELNVFNIMTVEDKFVGLSGANTWGMSVQDVASSESNVKFILEPDSLVYSLRTANGLLGTDDVASGSGVYGNKAAGANSEWSLVEVDTAVYSYLEASVLLKTALDEANATYDSTMFEAEVFATAIAAAQAVYDQGIEASVAEIEAAAGTLDDAKLAFIDANKEPSVVINKDDYVAFYTQDYEYVSTAADVWYSKNNQAGFSLVEEAGNNHIYYNHGSANSRGAYSDFDVDFTDVTEYLIEFDLALTAGNNQSTHFAVKGSDFTYDGDNIDWGVDSGYLFKLTTTNSTTWTIAGSGDVSYDVALNALEYYHYQALVSADGIQLTITDSLGNTVLDNAAITSASAGIECAGLYLKGGRYYSYMKIDNISLSKRIPETKVVWYMQDYENIATAADVWYSKNNQAGFSLVEEAGNKHIYYNHGNTNSRGAYTDFDVDFTDVDKYALEFDLALTAGNNQSTHFAVKGSDFTYDGDNIDWGVGSGYLFKLTATNSTTWTIEGSGDASYDVALNALEFYHYYAMVSADGIELTITDSLGNAVLEKAAITSASTGIECAGLYLKGGRYYSYMKIDNISFSKFVKGAVMVEPTVLMTGVDGISRTISMLSTQADAILMYAAVSAEDYEAAIELSDIDTTNYTWQIYAAPFAVSADTTYLVAYATDGSVNSPLVKYKFAAGTEVVLNAPVISLIAVNGTEKTYSISSDNSDVLFAPVSAIHYEYGDNSGVYTDPLAISETCTLTATASAEGYTSVSTSIQIDGRTNYRVAKSYDFTNIDQVMFDLMIANGWTANLDSLNVFTGVTLAEGAGSDKNADNLFYLDQDSVKIQYFPDFAAAFDTYIIRNGADGNSAGIYSQSSGDRNVTVSNITAGQFVEYVIDSVSYIVQSTGTSCTYRMTRYKTLQKVNVFIPDIYLNVQTKSIDITAAGEVFVDYNAEMDILQEEVLSITGSVHFNRTFGAGYEAFVSPFNKPVLLDADQNELVRGSDYVIKRLSSGKFAKLSETANIVANTVGYVIKVVEKHVGQPITFLYESETGLELGTAQTTFNAPSSGIAYKTNRRLIRQALGTDTTTVYAYVMNDEGTAFVKTANPVIPALQACIMADSATLATLDVILVDIPDALNAVSNDRVVVSRSYYDLNGIRLLEPGVGINIERTLYEDGAIETKKIIIYAK